jgi:hypothetical protein
MRRAAMGAVLCMLMTAGPARAADPTSYNLTTNPDRDEFQEAPGAPSHLILPGQAEGTNPAPTLPPLWLVPLPNAATRAAERAALDADLQARFGPAPQSLRRFDYDVMPLAGGQDWQRLQRRVDATVGTEKITLP